MALVAFLRGVNVGGHRRLRPTTLARQLRHLDVVSIGATGTFVVREPVGRKQLRSEIARRLPFDAEIAICRGGDVAQLLAHESLATLPGRADIVRFVSVLVRRASRTPDLPIAFPSRGKWLLKVLARDGRFVFGAYRRDMRVIRHLGELDRAFGVPVTTRNWNTIAAVAKVLNAGAT